MANLRVLAKIECMEGSDCPSIFIDDESGEIVVQGDRRPDDLAPRADHEAFVGGLTVDLLREAAAALG